MFGAIGTGHGKTLIALLAGSLLQVERPIILTAANLRQDVYTQWGRFNQHFSIHPGLRVFSYGELSTANGVGLFDQYQPDLIICDESDNLRYPTSARTGRFLRYFADCAKSGTLPYLVAMTGTITNGSILDYAHLLQLALLDNAPVPVEKGTLHRWSNVLDRDKIPNKDDFDSMAIIAPEIEDRSMSFSTAITHCRGRYRALLQGAFGYVYTETQSTDTPLLFQKIVLRPCPETDRIISDIRDSWVRPDGEELCYSLEVYRLCRQVAQGFYYLWNWPGNTPDTEWLERRALWHRAVRQVIKTEQKGYDTPFTVTRGIDTGQLRVPAAQVCLKNWRKVSHRPPPPTVCVWLSDRVLQAVYRWALARIDTITTGIIWYDQLAIANALRDCGIPVLNPGDDPIVDTMPIFAAAVDSFSAGKNWQAWQYNLILCSVGAAKMEQLISRTHRSGQKSSVYVCWLSDSGGPLDKALNTALDGATYIEQTTGNPQKLNSGKWLAPIVE
jgi:hypothetical protein